MRKTFIAYLLVALLAVGLPLYAYYTPQGADITVSSLVFEGATDDAFETTISIADPTADVTLTLPSAASAAFMTSSLTTNSATAANSVTGVSNGLLFEGATADGFEATVSPLTDPTADVTVSIPSLTAGSLMISSLTTNDVSAANGVWGASNALVFEGATADGFELSLAPADATADATITIPNSAGTVMLSSLATNAPDAANSVYGTSNNLAFEGATADTSETFFTPTDPTADRTITVPNDSGTLVLSPGAVVTLTNVDLDTSDNSIAANVCEDIVLTATGIAATDNIAYVMSTSDLSVTFNVQLHTPATNAITARTCNNSAGAVDPGAVADFRIVRINA